MESRRSQPLRGPAARTHSIQLARSIERQLLLTAGPLLLGLFFFSGLRPLFRVGLELCAILADQLGRASHRFLRCEYLPPWRSWTAEVFDRTGPPRSENARDARRFQQLDLAPGPERILRSPCHHDLTLAHTVGHR